MEGCNYMGAAESIVAPNYLLVAVKTWSFLKAGPEQNHARRGGCASGKTGATMCRSS